MHRTIHRIRAFGLSTYVSKKLHGFSPVLHRRLLGSSRNAFVRTAYGVDMASNWNDATFRMCVFGSHGTTLADLIEGQTRPFRFVDVGANQGLFSLLAANHPLCVGVTAFEPVPDTFQLLRRNVEHAGLAHQIECVQAAISAQTGEAQISMTDGHSGGASLSGRQRVGATGTTIKTLAASDLERYIPDDAELFIKIDVEGFEDVVVPELLQLSSAPQISSIFVEIDLNWVDFEPISASFRANGLTEFQRFGGDRHFDVLVKRP